MDPGNTCVASEWPIICGKVKDEQPSGTLYKKSFKYSLFSAAKTSQFSELMSGDRNVFIFCLVEDNFTKMFTGWVRSKSLQWSLL